ncbi:hypothetical protein ACWC2T_12075 [Streptomyces sp. NPDC001393]
MRLRRAGATSHHAPRSGAGLCGQHAARHMIRQGDGGMLRMGPPAGSRLTSDDWRSL